MNKLKYRDWLSRKGREEDKLMLLPYCSNKNWNIINQIRKTKKKVNGSGMTIKRVSNICTTKLSIILEMIWLPDEDAYEVYE